MTQTLEPCAFCGDSMIADNSGTFRHVDQGDCIIGMQAWADIPKYRAAWNTRPSPDLTALTSEVEQLRSEMERIADLSERWADSLVSQINEIARAALGDKAPATIVEKAGE